MPSDGEPIGFESVGTTLEGTDLEVGSLLDDDEKSYGNYDEEIAASPWMLRFKDDSLEDQYRHDMLPKRCVSQKDSHCLRVMDAREIQPLLSLFNSFH
jgi:hypothetical protein